MKVFLFIILLLFLISCTGKNNLTNPESKTQMYLPGAVGFGLKDSVTLEEFAEYIYSLNNISIDEIAEFQYLSNLQQDSIQIITTTFESKSYIRSGETYVTYQDSESKLLVTFWVKNFTVDDIKDWTMLRTRFQLYHSPFKFQDGILKVKVGTEKKWISFLSNSKLFRWVELEYYTSVFNLYK